MEYTIICPECGEHSIWVDTTVTVGVQDLGDGKHEVDTPSLETNSVADVAGMDNYTLCQACNFEGVLGDFLT